MDARIEFQLFRTHNDTISNGQHYYRTFFRRRFLLFFDVYEIYEAIFKSEITMAANEKISIITEWDARWRTIPLLFRSLYFKAPKTRYLIPIFHN